MTKVVCLVPNVDARVLVYFLCLEEWVKLIGNCMVYSSDEKTVVISR